MAAIAARLLFVPRQADELSEKYLRFDKTIIENACAAGSDLLA